LVHIRIKYGYTLTVHWRVTLSSIHFSLHFGKWKPRVAPCGSTTQTSLNSYRMLASKRCSCKSRASANFVMLKINYTSTRPSRFALCSANAGAKVLDRRRPRRRKWLKLGALSPTANYATADYAAILDRENLKNAEVLKELVRRAWSRLGSTPTPKPFESAPTQPGEWRRPSSLAQSTCMAMASSRQRSTISSLALPFLWPSSLHGATGQDEGGAACLPRSGCYD